MALYNLVRVHSSTRGTGTLTLGSAVTGWLDFSDVANGAVTYTIRNGSQTEIGHGTYNSSTRTLARTTILKSTNNDAAINIDDDCEVALTIAKEDFEAVQPLDATLTSLAALGTAADKIAYTTAVDTWAETTLTSFGRSLIDDANAAAARTTLGLGTMAVEPEVNYYTTTEVDTLLTNYQPLDADLTALAGVVTQAYGRSLLTSANEAAFKALVNLEIGVDVQAYDAELAALAGLVSAADQLPYFTGLGTASLATFTAFARTLVDDADAATARTTLGADDSNNVNFLQAGTGAVSRTVRSKLRDVVCVKDFGTTGDGVADDTAKIQAALNSGAKVVHLVPGENYKISSGLTVPAGVFIEGNQGTLTASAHIFLLNFVNGGGIKNAIMTGPGGAAYTANSSAIYCSGTNNAPAAPTYVTGPTVENCTISGFGQYGVFLSYVRKAKIIGNRISVVGYAGIGGVSCEDVIVDGNTIYDITAGSVGGDSYGVFLDRNNGTSETAEPRSYRCIVTNNLFKNIVTTSVGNGHAIDTHGGVDFLIDGNTINECEGGIYLTASSISGNQALGCIRCVVSNNVIYSTLFKRSAILLYGARTGSTVAEHATDCVVSGNVIQGHGALNASDSAAILLSATKNCAVTGNVIREAGGNSICLDFQNLGVNISGNQFTDPKSTTWTAVSCIYIVGNDNKGYIGGNTYRFVDSGVGTYVAINSVRINAALTGLDLDFGRSGFEGIASGRLAFTALTTTGVHYYGLATVAGNSTISVLNGGADGITDVTIDRMPYTPKILISLRYPYNQGGKFPILGIDHTGVAPGPTNFRIYAKPADGTTWTASGSIEFDWVAL